MKTETFWLLVAIGITAWLWGFFDGEHAGRENHRGLVNAAIQSGYKITDPQGNEIQEWDE